MVFWNQCVYIYEDYISPRIFFPLVHYYTPIPILPEMGAFG